MARFTQIITPICCPVCVGSGDCSGCKGNGLVLIQSSDPREVPALGQLVACLKCIGDGYCVICAGEGQYSG
jgi:hypothetical protein